MAKYFTQRYSNTNSTAQMEARKEARILFQDHNDFFFILDTTGELVESPEGDLYEQTEEYFIEKTKEYFDERVASMKSDVLTKEKEYRDKYLQFKHPSELVAAVSFKIAESKAIVAATDTSLANLKAIAPNVSKEAEIRGVSPIYLANLVLATDTGVTVIETYISGIAGRKTDEISAIEFDEADLATTIDNLNATVEVNIGTDEMPMTVQFPKYDANRGWEELTDNF